MAEKKKNKLGAKAIFARILAVILVTAIGGVASFFGFKTYFLNKLKKDKKAEIAKQLKEESKEIIEKLKKRKIEVIMLTGDNEKTANAIAKQLGIEKVVANVLPNQKAEEIKKLKEQGLVMMCGDGINDSVSLVTADIGVSISSGTDIAMDSAEVVLMNDNLEKIEELIEISKKTIRNIKQNLFWAFFYNICMVPIACGILQPFGITMNPMIAAFAMTISSLTVVLNALRLR